MRLLASIVGLVVVSIAPVPYGVFGAETPPLPGTVHFPGLISAPLPLPITLEDGSRYTLDGMVVRPDRPGRFPLALLTHGEPYDFSETTAWMPTILLLPAVAFAQRGYTAVMFLRRGFGSSQGPYAEGHGPCGARNYLRATQASGEDVLGVLSALRSEEWIDPQRVLLVGQSSGAVAVTAAAAQNALGIVGILNFAGGRGSLTTNALCHQNWSSRYGAPWVGRCVCPVCGSLPRTTSISPRPLRAKCSTPTGQPAHLRSSSLRRHSVPTGICCCTWLRLRLGGRW